MSYDLAVWVGERPLSDQAAALQFRQLMEEGELTTGPPAPRIRAYVDALLARWPDITTAEGAESPWASAPLIEEASGSAVHLPVVLTRAEEATEYAARVAEAHGLICFDPQTETLRP